MNAVWSRYQSSAATRGLRFELSRARFVQLVTRACFYCGQAPREVPNRKTSLRLNGIDRVDNTRGYTEDNVRSCCTTCNTGKLRQTQQEFYAWTTRVHEALNADPPDDHYFAQFEGADE